MSITSLGFLIFIATTLVLYYIVPQKVQWIILLLASIVFYILSGAEGMIFVLITSASIYVATVWMNRITENQKALLKASRDTLSKEQKNQIKNKNKKLCKALMICTLILNFGIMCIIKYSSFAVESINSLIGTNFLNNGFKLIVPLGLSFYTFQSTAYLINVYWGNCKAEKNYFKVLLFVSFFPQITQGPISEFDQLSCQLFSGHSFKYKNYAWGFQRMLWGFAKKMIIANTLSPFVLDVFKNYNQYVGISVLIGAFLYSVQIYADFSGYMDIMCGYCEMLGINLSENFERPYFSKSVAEYWRRWHITLGAWFKQYIYYPIAISKWNRALSKRLTDKFGKSVGKNLPATIALIVVWLTTGLWHGASWAYVAWGGVNGLFIIFSMWMEPVYHKTKSLLRVNESSWIWNAFSVLRTFVLVTFIKVLPEVGTLSQGLGLWKRIFTDWTLPSSFAELLPFVNLSLTVKKISFAVMVVFVLIHFVISLIQRKNQFRMYFNRLPLFIRIFVLSVLSLLVFSFGTQATWGAGGFMYAQF